MGPKVESALRFLRSGGKEVIISSYEHLCEAVAGRAGTRILPAAHVQTPDGAAREKVTAR
jgi:carbamate kinase